MTGQHIEKLSSALDRFHEAHFWIHTLEQYYHSSDLFRWHLNAFLKALKEVQDLIPMGLQNTIGFKKWYEPYKLALRKDPLLASLAHSRDIAVHKGALVVKSGGSIGITKGRGMKLGFAFPIDPRQDSLDAMEDFVRRLAYYGDPLGFLANDEGTAPCVERTWKLPQYDDEIVDLCSKAWLRLGETIAEVVIWLGGERPPINLQCRHSSQRVQFMLFDRKPLRAQLRAIRAQDGFEREQPSDDFLDWADRGEQDEDF